MFPTRQLGRTVSVVNTTAEGKHAVEELTVYLRAMKAAQRRWAREVVAHESHVRRLMLVEEQCREKLKQQVLRGTREHLKYLTNTDLMAVSQLVSPPTVDAFLAHGIPAQQVSGFGVYAMGCVAADANRLDVPLPVLLADLSSAWAILPPTKKDAFNELAGIFRAHVPPRVDPVEAPSRAMRTAKSRRSRTRTLTSANTRTSKLAKLALSGAASKAGNGKPEKRAAAVAVVPARHRLHARASKQSAPRTRGATAIVTPLLANGSREGNRDAAARVEASHTAHNTPPKQRCEKKQRKQPQPQKKHLVRMETDAMEAFARQLPPAEYDAFCIYAQESLHEMELALGASIIPVSKTNGCGNKGAAQTPSTRSGCRKNGGGKGVVVSAHSRTLPRGVRLFMKEWLPIAAEEWIRKTRRQKSLYMMKS
ncbi:putative mitochondrial hypothetical protein [Leptomonas pyrrhocoris]|uniref:Uncharacterized protein n=1 Tax=Leptomonas pyrrhocoris TaxID=157538 RepID=A0A0M9FXW5_LEPPY|nr:putative mitochondrial hypothetical protein [Leptomonas pyrrhocoris]XP_015656619.1 putative mitochondrial hypothetical protein [Leptomonas pyrrhocoris]KPA78179.1 putative mitochondrial hypothetical protein [Leptomonas pyrrhocoris]KPA78180.1 putative mitochondrial hypothetical protein [Leptomonas pyrrhocoris]|eukprot:XP_015656618.1 putative mitochondrial hypothetical protein [Leptomonas pyrrhocoris]